MPSKEISYRRVIFNPELINEAEKVLVSTVAEDDRKIRNQFLRIQLSDVEKREYDTEDEFSVDYRKGFVRAYLDNSYASGNIEVTVYRNDTRVSVSLPSGAALERVFNIFEANVEKCRLPRQAKTKSKIETDWITETVNKVEGRCPIAGRKLKLALIKLDSEEAEEWQNATMLIRDAWIELSQWLCQVKNIDTSDVPPDSVIDRLKKLKIDKADERLFNLARASFSLYSKHHKRDIDEDTAVACVISTIVSMQTVIRGGL